MIKDHLNRTFKALRVSLTNSCNFSCHYCVSGWSNPVVKNTLPPEEFVEIIKSIHRITPLTKIRLTGGEPLLYQHICTLIKGIKKLGIENIGITTNAFLLPKKASMLKEAGLSSANISLDAIEESTFKKITRQSKINPVLNGIEKALEVGIPLKLNAVIMKGINDDQIIPLYRFAKAKRISIRFLEVMKMGHLHSSKTDYLYKEENMLTDLRRIAKLTSVKREKSATATYWEDQDGFKVGFISNSSKPFCSDCDRLRIDHQGRIYGCISSINGIDIKKDYKNQPLLSKNLFKSLKEKQSLAFTGSDISMKQIGG
ncbi:GTP 3',8-cyclase MoaA [Xanthovirga aplysinae]|uniref:GTP 3',8-cyclase MoaA n=1 Tax=Xanthovirga aplysinae TaxID=2529853 RepID=UPI0012BB784E|nr:GTP 3',8-cyclase MoaA [Xanthovirga aplysinae]MTI32442.1 radical SAM protein [Xanthovirga aplysinae]